MVSVLDLQHRPSAEESTPAISVEAAGSPDARPEEYEIVLGRRQVASLLFVFSIILMTCVAASYMAGKAMAPKESAAAAPAVVREPDPPPIVLNQEAVPVVEAPLFAEPRSGSVYIQMGAVEKGVSMIFAQGLRKYGLPAFVAPGPSEKIYRVLIGPLPDPASYVRAKDVVDKIGLATFARKFPN